MGEAAAVRGGGAGGLGRGVAEATPPGFAHPGTGVAAHLGVAVAQAEMDRIGAAWRTASVRAFAATVADLPPERVVNDGRVFLFDRVTQVHRTHIGDGRIGKWRERFDAPAQAELNRVFGPFLARFGYDPA